MEKKRVFRRKSARLNDTLNQEITVGKAGRDDAQKKDPCFWSQTDLASNPGVSVAFNGGFPAFLQFSIGKDADTTYITFGMSLCSTKESCSFHHH